MTQYVGRTGFGLSLSLGTKILGTASISEKLSVLKHPRLLMYRCSSFDCEVFVNNAALVASSRWCKRLRDNNHRELSGSVSVAASKRSSSWVNRRCLRFVVATGARPGPEVLSPSDIVAWAMVVERKGFLPRRALVDAKEILGPLTAPDTLVCAGEMLLVWADSLTLPRSCEDL